MKTERFVTRTVFSYFVKALCYDVGQSTLCTKIFPMGADYDPAKGEKTLRKECESATLKIVEIKENTPVERLYKVPENVFISEAKPLPPRGEGGRTRERMVTRTICDYAVECLVYRPATEKLETVLLRMGRDYDPAKGEKQVRKAYENADLRIVQVGKLHTREQLYGMSERYFISLSLAYELNEEKQNNTPGTTEYP